MARTRLAGMKALLAVVALGLGVGLGGCSTEVVGQPVGSPPAPGPGPSAAPEASGTGITAKPVSSAFAVEARDIRVVRVGDDRMALQFEFFNDTDQPLEPQDLAIHPTANGIVLADLPRGTNYEMLSSPGPGLLSGYDEEVAPQESTTVTAMFAAPSAETGSLVVVIDGVQPVEVPVLPAGSAALRDDPLLREGVGLEPRIRVAICERRGPSEGDEPPPVEIRLPSDVLFAFGKADLSPAAQEAIDAVETQIRASGGTITIEGHTDSIGDDASNQQLSEARAAAVATALQAVLGGGFTFETAGFGEAKPVASNTNPDGSDSPDGRALNRRVEIRTGSTAPAARPTLEPVAPTNDLAELGLVAEVDGLELISGHVLARVTVSNPTSSPIEVSGASGLRAGALDAPFGLTLADHSSQRRHLICSNPGGAIGISHLGNTSSDYSPDEFDVVPAGTSVVFWGVYAPPAAGTTTLDVEVGGFGMTVPTTIGG